MSGKMEGKISAVWPVNDVRLKLYVSMAENVGIKILVAVAGNFSADRPEKAVDGEGERRIARGSGRRKGVKLADVDRVEAAGNAGIVALANKPGNGVFGIVRGMDGDTAAVVKRVEGRCGSGEVDDIILGRAVDKVHIHHLGAAGNDRLAGINEKAGRSRLGYQEGNVYLLTFELINDGEAELNVRVERNGKGKNGLFKKSVDGRAVGIGVAFEDGIVEILLIESIVRGRNGRDLRKRARGAGETNGVGNAAKSEDTLEGGGAAARRRRSVAIIDTAGKLFIGNIILVFLKLVVKSGYEVIGSVNVRGSVKPYFVNTGESAGADIGNENTAAVIFRTLVDKAGIRIFIEKEINGGRFIIKPKVFGTVKARGEILGFVRREGGIFFFVKDISAARQRKIFNDSAFGLVGLFVTKSLVFYLAVLLGLRRRKNLKGPTFIGSSAGFGVFFLIGGEDVKRNIILIETGGIGTVEIDLVRVVRGDGGAEAAAVFGVKNDLPAGTNAGKLGVKQNRAVGIEIASDTGFPELQLGLRVIVRIVEKSLPAGIIAVHERVADNGSGRKRNGYKIIFVGAGVKDWEVAGHDNVRRKRFRNFVKGDNRTRNAKNRRILRAVKLRRNGKSKGISAGNISGRIKTEVGKRRNVNLEAGVVAVVINSVVGLIFDLGVNAEAGDKCIA